MKILLTRSLPERLCLITLVNKLQSILG